MRFHLILISFSLFAISSCEITSNYSQKELLDSFHKTSAYINYQKEKPITSQVVVTIKVEGIDEVFFFPNPYLASLFEDFLNNNINLNYSSSY